MIIIFLRAARAPGGSGATSGGIGAPTRMLEACRRRPYNESRCPGGSWVPPAPRKRAYDPQVRTQAYPTTHQDGPGRTHSPQDGRSTPNKYKHTPAIPDPVKQTPPLAERGRGSRPPLLPG